MNVKVKDLSYSITDGAHSRAVFDKFSRSFESGSVTAITGPSGCGKTSLLSILSLLVHPSGGSVFYGGIDLSLASESQRDAIRRRDIALMFQTARTLQNLTVEEHIRFTLACMKTPALFKNAVEQLESLGVENLLPHTPNQMSGGEKQRVAIVLALLKNPSVLLADEPTAFLDMRNSRGIIQYVRNYTRKNSCITIIVTHDQHVLDRSDAVVNFGDMCA